jgi:superfamily I DNA/RNA helicase
VRVAGDDDQAIYQWRGSNVDNMLTFRKRYRAKSFPLSTNYRCRPGIIEAANTFARTFIRAFPRRCTWTDRLAGRNWSCGRLRRSTTKPS